METIKRQRSRSKWTAIVMGVMLVGISGGLSGVRAQVQNIDIMDGFMCASAGGTLEYGNGAPSPGGVCTFRGVELVDVTLMLHMPAIFEDVTFVCGVNVGNPSLNYVDWLSVGDSQGFVVGCGM